MNNVGFRKYMVLNRLNVEVQSKKIPTNLVENRNEINSSFYTAMSYRSLFKSKLI